jgi:hypothetical protein
MPPMELLLRSLGLLTVGLAGVLPRLIELSRLPKRLELRVLMCANLGSHPSQLLLLLRRVGLLAVALVLFLPRLIELGLLAKRLGLLVPMWASVVSHLTQ